MTVVPARVDLTGLTGRMQIRETKASADTIMDLTTENGRLTFGGTNGVVTMTLTATETATILTDGVYDLEFVTSATSCAAGPGPMTFTIQEITNPAESIGITSCTGQFTPPIVSASDVLGAMVTA